ncbi:hypothetical protein AB205_0130200, partial [Aquarana catesbeiana]
LAIKEDEKGKKTQMLTTIHSSHRMSLPRSIALLLLCAIVTLANAQSCPAINDTTTTNNNYTLTAPSSVTNGITYQVHRHPIAPYTRSDIPTTKSMDLFQTDVGSNLSCTNTNYTNLVGNSEHQERGDIQLV